MSLAYHRMFRILPTYRWWKPLLAIVAAGILYFVFSYAYQAIVLAIVGAVGGPSAATDLARAQLQDQQNASNPLVMLLTLGALATMLPAVLLAVRIARLGRPGTLASVTGRIRWRWLARCIVPGVVYVVLVVGLNYVVPVSWQGEGATTSGRATPLVPLIVSMVLILLFVPLQASAEEFAFRGLGTQAFGSWFRWPVVAIVVPTVGFAFAHSYNVWGKLDVAVLGVSFAYLTWRTGGLEAGIVAHVLNNVVVFLLAAPVVTDTQSDGSPAGLGITVVASIVYVLMVTWLARRHGPLRESPVSLRESPVESGPALHSRAKPGPGVVPSS